MRKIALAFSCLITLLCWQPTYAKTGLFFDISATGTPADINITLCLNGTGPLSCQNYHVSAVNLNIKTTVPNHTYPGVGIKINTPGYSVANLGCTPLANGYCVFSANNTTPKNIFINNISGYYIGGSLSGLTAGPLVLQNNEGDNLTVPVGATSFQFATPVAFGNSYSVTVLQQPPGLTCTVGNSEGIYVVSSVANVSVVCNINTATISGNIPTLPTSGLILQNNGSDDLSVASGSPSFEFSPGVAIGGSYNVSVLTQPLGYTCTVVNGSGINVIADITTVSVICNINTFTVGGTVSGLTAIGLVLRNNGSGDLTVSSGATSFQFASPIPFNSSYNVTVARQPMGLTCSVNQGSGTNINDNVTNIRVVCNINTFTIGGTISGLTANGLVLRNNGDNDQVVFSGATSFQFTNPVTYSSNYNVTIAQQPADLICTVSNGSGTNVTANVGSVTISCNPAAYTIGGTVTALTADGLTLQNNGGNNLLVPLGASDYTFTLGVANGGSYDVTILQQPTGILCGIFNSSGTDVTADIINVDVNCNSLTSSLTTLFSAGNSQKGIMFNLTNTTEYDVLINSFITIFSSSGSTDVSVYYLTSPAIGNETNSSVWLNAGTVNLSVTQDVQTTLPIGGIYIPSGATYGFYFYSTQVAFSYTNGSNVYNSGQLSLQTLNGRDGLFIGQIYPDRLWNGTINYSYIP